MMLERSQNRSPNCGFTKTHTFTKSCPPKLFHIGKYMKLITGHYIKDALQPFQVYKQNCIGYKSPNLANKAYRLANVPPSTVIVCLGMAGELFSMV